MKITQNYAPFFCLTLWLCMYDVTRKIRAMICLHDSSEIIAWTENFFSCHLHVVKRRRFFNASYNFHVYLIGQ